MSSYHDQSFNRLSDDTMDDTDDKDDSKRKSRNLSEKKRRDQFNMLINELCTMVSTNNRKMDKSTVLKSTIAFLKNYNEIENQSRVHEIQEDWKPSFLSNEEFTHLILEALDGFIMVFSSSGRILYVSESITSLLRHLPSDLLNSTIYDLVYEEDHSNLYNTLLNPTTTVSNDNEKENQITFVCHCKRGAMNSEEEITYELVQFVGYFRADMDSLKVDNSSRSSTLGSDSDTRLVFICIGRLQTPQLIREMSVIESKCEFTSRHSLEWKFLFLDHRAPPIIGYLPFEVLGTSGYDYYHVDDLDSVVTCHEALMQKGEGTSCYYRFLTKGQQWIWLQTRFYITYHQWNSKPEFIVCTHRVVSYVNVLRRDGNNSQNVADSEDTGQSNDTVGPGDSNTSKSTILSSSNMSWGSSKSASVASRQKTREKSRHRRSHHHGGSFSDVASSETSRSHHHHKGRSKIHTHSRSVASLGGVSSTNQCSSISTTVASVKSEPIGPTLDTPPAGFLDPSPGSVAFPVKPLLAPGFPSHSPISPASLVTSMTNQRMPVPSLESHNIQYELQRKHEQLQQMIVQQQEELRRVSEQLIMAKYGLLPAMLNTSPLGLESYSQHPPSQNPTSISPRTTLYTTQQSSDVDPSYNNNVSRRTHSQHSHQSTSSADGVLPYQLPGDQQAPLHMIYQHPPPSGNSDK
uniref:Circadian locomoter output cycles protein kaput n=1 Tax=Cacopsylla melanoneura TaxID=428564 RepID=A0A8D8SI98_9HEMI